MATVAFRLCRPPRAVSGPETRETQFLKRDSAGLSGIKWDSAGRALAASAVTLPRIAGYPDRRDPFALGLHGAIIALTVARRAPH